jgi:peroxiredoxin
VPCKKGFKHLVEMQKRFAKDGVVCMSVSVDEVKNHGKALDFLKSQGATFANYLLDEETAFWQEKWDMNGPPAVFVFDQQNQRAAKFDCNDPDKPYDHEDVDKAVRQLLRGGR